MKNKVVVSESVNGFDSFIEYLRNVPKPSNTVGGYVFPNKESADRFIKYCKENNIKY